MAIYQPSPKNRDGFSRSLVPRIDFGLARPRNTVSEPLYYGRSFSPLRVLALYVEQWVFTEEYHLIVYSQ